MTFVRIDEQQILGELQGCLNFLQRDAIYAGVDEGGKVIERAYRDTLKSAHQDGRPPGGKNFKVAFESVDRKTESFKDGIGAFSVIGIQMVGGRPKAPQARFDENGTVMRETEDGYNRGKVLARHWLHDASTLWAEEAREVMLRTVQQHVANRANGSG